MQPLAAGRMVSGHQVHLRTEGWDFQITSCNTWLQMAGAWQLFHRAGVQKAPQADEPSKFSLEVPLNS